MLETPLDPYQPPAQLENELDEKIIELLLRYKRRVKVVNVLRQDGLKHKDAMAIVEHHVPIAQAMINRNYIVWTLMGGLLFVTATFVVAAIAHYSIFGFIPFLILAVVSYSSYFCLQKREVIR